MYFLTRELFHTNIIRTEKSFIERPTMNKIRCFIFMIIAFTVLIKPLYAQDYTVREEKLKAVFIYNFTKYIKWDETDDTRPFTITVIGKSGIIEQLNEIRFVHRREKRQK